MSMMVIMHEAATEEEVRRVCARVEDVGAAAHLSLGDKATVIGAIGERELLADAAARGLRRASSRCCRSCKPYKLVSRELSPDPTVIEVRGRRIGDGYFGFIAGPCTVETREQTLETARAVKRPRA